MPVSLAPLLCLLLLLGGSFAGPLLAAQETGSAQSTQEDAVMATVNRLFDGMRARDGEVVASVFHPEARLVTTAVTPDGTPSASVQPIEGFVAAVGQEGAPWDEPLFETEVRVDGPLADVWTFYRFYRGEEFSHCGHNSIQLVRTSEGWRIISIADTRRTENCDAP
ncbi:MAG: nuclear transport factor 2 family protein [Gemmatimonadota bacterium]